LPEISVGAQQFQPEAEFSFQETFQPEAHSRALKDVRQGAPRSAWQHFDLKELEHFEELIDRAVER
jgi:hypothetical protein